MDINDMESLIRLAESCHDVNLRDGYTACMLLNIASSWINYKEILGDNSNTEPTEEYYEECGQRLKEVGKEDLALIHDKNCWLGVLIEYWPVCHHGISVRGAMKERKWFKVLCYIMDNHKITDNYKKEL